MLLDANIIEVKEICLGEIVRDRGGLALKGIGLATIIPGVGALTEEVQDTAEALAGTSLNHFASLRRSKREATWRRWPGIWRLSLNPFEIK